VTLAKAAIQRAGRALGVTATVRFVVNPDARQTGDHVIGHVTIFNPQTDQGMVKGLGPLAGITVPALRTWQHTKLRTCCSRTKPQLGGRPCNNFRLHQAARRRRDPVHALAGTSRG